MEMSKNSSWLREVAISLQQQSCQLKMMEKVLQFCQRAISLVHCKAIKIKRRPKFGRAGSSVEKWECTWRGTSCRPGDAAGNGGGNSFSKVARDSVCTHNHFDRARDICMSFALVHDASVRLFSVRLWNYMTQMRANMNTSLMLLRSNGPSTIVTLLFARNTAI